MDSAIALRPRAANTLMMPTVQWCLVPHSFQTLLASRGAKFLLTGIVALVMSIVLRPTLVLAPVFLVAAALYVANFNPEAPVRQLFGSTARMAAPYVGLFLLAVAAAAPTSFVVEDHLSLIPKILGLQVAVLLFFALGRCVGQVEVRSLLNWTFAMVAVTSILAIIEQCWLPLHTLLGAGASYAKIQDALLNRTMMLLSLVLMFFLIVGRDIGNRLFVVGAGVLLCVLFVVTASEAARLIMLIAVFVLFLSTNNIKRCLTAAVVVAILLMIVGPFIYDPILKMWEASPFADFKKTTIHARLVIWAEFSSLILDSEFWGRGLNSSKQLVFDNSLYKMPYNFYGWHPHNAGLEIVTDLGWIGGVWLAGVFWALHNAVRNLDTWFQRGLAGLFLGLLAILYSADGLWQSWWWFAIAQFAMFIGLLYENQSLDGTNQPGAPHTADGNA